MPKTNICFFEITDNQKEYLNKKLSKNFDLQFFAEEVQNVDKSKFNNAEIIAVFVGSVVDKNTIDSLPNLKLITTMSTGFDHIDIGYAKEKGIAVTNVPTYGENTVAEHTFALILSISRKIIESNKQLKSGDFSSTGLTGFDLKDKTIGVIGCGNIGANVIKMANGFDMKIIGFDLNKSEALQKEFGLKYVEMDTLFKESDIITLHVPLNEHTKHLINRESIKIMKKGVIIINTARGPLIETDALYDALVEEHVAFAGIDVFEEEGFLKEEAEILHNDEKISADMKTVITNHVLINHNHVIATPHNAFNSNEAIIRILNTTIKNIVELKLRREINLVNK